MPKLCSLEGGRKTMETNRATEHMAKGYVCSESVLLGVCEELGIKVDDKIIPRIGRLFAGGIGRTGSVCGAVAGGVMALGLVVEPGKTMEEGLAAMRVAEEFRRRFESEMGSINCRDLTGLDLTTAEGMKGLMGTDTSQTVCFPAVAAAYRIVLDLLHEAS
jgi:C_GCAxxG_C_C family probable redox protein